MATDMADQGHDMHAHFSPPPPGLSSTHPGTHPDVHPVPASSSHSDQDVLFDLILQRVPPPKQEMLSTSWSRDYLNRLTSLPARALQSEPEKLREEHQKVERDMSELAFRDYKAFILVKDCKQEVQTTFESLGQHLDRFQDSIPEFVETLSGCSARVAPLLEQQHVYGTILASHSQLLEVLEIPLLMETCVRNGYYSEALELAAHVQRLAYRYPGIGVIEDIETKVGQGKEMMLVQLLAQLREPIKLPVALRVVGFLRRIGSFKGQVKSFDDDDADDADDDEDEERGKNGNHRDKAGNSISSKGTGLERTRNSHSSSSSSGPRGSPHETGLEDETPLRMLFLKSRGQYMNQQLAKIVFHKGDSFGYLKKYIDVTRECLFDIMTYYKSIFSSLDQFMTGSSSSGSYSSTGFSLGATGTDPRGTRSHSALGPWQHCWTIENLLADFVAYRTQTLLRVLEHHIPQIQETSALSSILTQLMYFGANMAKIGFDLRYVVTSMFEEAVIRVVGGAFQRGADEFLDGLGGEGRMPQDWLLPSQWMLGGTGRPTTTASSPSTSSLPTASSNSPVLGRGTTGSPSTMHSSLSPQTVLMDYPALAYLTNAYLSALNSLRLLAPLSLAIPLRGILVDSLIKVDRAMEQYDRLIFGERSAAFRSTLAPPIEMGMTNMGSRVEQMDRTMVLSEQRIMDGFVVVYKRAVQDYILKCFDEGIYGGLVHLESLFPGPEKEEEEEEVAVVVEEEAKEKENEPLESQVESSGIDPAEPPTQETAADIITQAESTSPRPESEPSAEQIQSEPEETITEQATGAERPLEAE